MDSVRIESNGLNFRNEQFYNAVLGSDFYINKYNTITVSGNFAYEIEKQPSETYFIETIGNAVNEWSREESTQALNPKYQYDVQYKKEFKDTNEHVLMFSTLGKFFGKDQESMFTNRLIEGSLDNEQQRTRTNFKQADYTFKLDYFHPFNKKFQFDCGAQYVINNVGNDYAVDDLDSGTWVSNADFTNNFIYNQSVLGVYSTGSLENKKWGIKVGLRAENTQLETELTTTGEENDQQYTNLFPTAHTSYKFSKYFSLQAGYSRRIYRPRLWDLNPFFNISNNFNIRTGNPALLPEFTDSYELTSLYFFKKMTFNLGVYYRFTDGKIDRVSIFENNVNRTMPMNIGTNDVAGVEFNTKITPWKWFTFMGDFNYRYFQRKGKFLTQVFYFTGDQWNAKGTLKFKVNKQFDIECSGNYQSEILTVQGNNEAVMFMNAGLRYKLWKGRGVVNFSVRDIFASRIQRRIVDQDGFYLYNKSYRGRFMTLGFSYSIGKGEAMTYSGGRRY